MNREIEHGDGTQEVPTAPRLAIRIGDSAHDGSMIWRDHSGYTVVDIDHCTVSRYDRVALLKERKGEKVFLSYSESIGIDLDHPEVIWFIGWSLDHDILVPDGATLLWDSKYELD